VKCYEIGTGLFRFCYYVDNSGDFLVSYAWHEIHLWRNTQFLEVSSVVILNQEFALDNTGLFKRIVSVLTTCHTQCT